MSDNENIFPKKFHLDLTALEEVTIELARETAKEHNMFFDTTTAYLLIDALRYVNGSNKLRRNNTDNII